MKPLPQSELHKLIGHTLHTLDRNQPFTIQNLAPGQIKIIVGSTGNSRSIPLAQIEAAWQELVEAGELSRATIRAKFSSFNPAYVAAILAVLPGVTYENKPITLLYKL